MTSRLAPLAVTMGDPAGCGPQITVETWKAREQHALYPFFVIGDPRLYANHVEVEAIETPAQAIDLFATALPVLPLTLPAFETLSTGTPSGVFAPAIVDSIERATALSLSTDAAGIVTNPISKSVLYAEGFSFPGHTEFIASLCAASDQTTSKPVMMLVGGGLRVALATIHVPLMQVLDHLTPTSLIEIATTTHTAMVRDFGITSPKIAFTGLNPHAGEDATIGTEERDLINPVAANLRQSGINITDARSADTVFHEALHGGFDAVIAMTHDQGLIPVKTLDMWGGVNTTLGLPVIRTSPDHGTAYDAAAKSACRPDSLIAALKLAADLATHRASSNV